MKKGIDRKALSDEIVGTAGKIGKSTDNEVDFRLKYIIRCCRWGLGKGESLVLCTEEVTVMIMLPFIIGLIIGAILRGLG